MRQHDLLFFKKQPKTDCCRRIPFPHFSDFSNIFYVLAIGFYLAFGAQFSKNWRIVHVLHGITHTKVKFFLS